MRKKNNSTHSRNKDVLPTSDTPVIDSNSTAQEDIQTATQPLHIAAQHDHKTDTDTEGEVCVAVLDVVQDDNARPREELKVALKKRLDREGRWAEVEPVRDEMMREARKTMDKASAQAWVYSELDRLYPPQASYLDTQVDVTVEVPGVYLVPSAWPPLGTASLQTELAWVQEERLRVVETVGQRTTVHLDRASTPAPSMSALGWLETSVRSYAKYIDVLARAMSTQADEQEHTRRERLAIEEIDSLLRELCDDEQGKR